MKRRAIKLISVAASLLIVSGCGGKNDDESAFPDTASISFFVGPDNTGATRAAINRCNKQSNGAYTINYQLLPTAREEQRQVLSQRLASQDDGVDIMAMGVTWTAEFATSGWLHEWTGSDRALVTNGVFEPSVAGASYEDKLYAAPQTASTQLLWYRNDLVATAPTTWDEMVSQSEQLADDGKPHYVSVQGARPDELVGWFNSLVSSAGGSVVDESTGRPTPSDATTAAATIMHKVATSPAADPNLSKQEVGQTPSVFERGEAAFQVNRSSAWTSAKKTPDVLKTMGYAPYPAVRDGEAARTSVGGTNIGVSTFTDHPRQALDAAECLRDAQSQKVLAITAGRLPASSVLFDDPDVRSSMPFADIARTQLQNASLLPQTSQYGGLSVAIRSVLSPLDDIDVEQFNGRLQTAVNDAIDF